MASACSAPLVATLTSATLAVPLAAPPAATVTVAAHPATGGAS